MSTPEHETITDLSDVRPDDVATFQKGPQTTLTGPVVYVIPEGGICLRSHGQVDDGWDFVSATRPAPPTPAPGTVGTATVVSIPTGNEGQHMRCMRTSAGYAFESGLFVDDESDVYRVRDFVPDADTAALRAEVERLEAQTARDRADLDAAASMRERLQHEVAKLREAQAIIAAERDTHLQGLARVAEERNAERARADAAEARLARVLALLDAPGDDVSCAGRNLTEPGCFAHDLAARIRALVAGDEQAAQGVSPEVSPTLARAGEQETPAHRPSARNCVLSSHGEPISSGTVCRAGPVPGVGGAA